MATERSNSGFPRMEASPWPVVLACALAGALGWGIRGQYGHQTGAMIAGVLVGLVMAGWFSGAASGWAAARIAALAATGISFGGSMTYAQTIGLTHDAAFVGNVRALLWGMLGLALKGAIWAGFCGVLLGVGMGGKSYRPLELGFLFLGLTVIHLAGMRLINQPFDPEHRVLPHLYFSADWRWNPSAKIKPRFENWGGLLCALLVLIGWVRFRKRDLLAARLGGWAMLGGALGFPLAQCLQAFHAWHLASFKSGPFAQIDPIINWWNFMETAFGAIWAGVLGYGAWRNRGLIAPLAKPDSSIPGWLEGITVGLYALFLWAAQFGEIRWASALLDLALPLGAFSLAMTISGRWWPYLLTFPLVLGSIAGKTLREMSYKEHDFPLLAGWLLFLIVPLAAASALAIWFARNRAVTTARFAAIALPFCAWMYFALNYAFFRWPWPWQHWTSRTPNMLVFFACALGLTLFARKLCEVRAPLEPA